MTFAVRSTFASTHGPIAANTQTMAMAMAMAMARSPRIVGGAPATVARRLATRRALQSRLARLFALVPVACLLIGHLLFVLLPLPIKPIRTRTYVDENALQPAQAHLFWGWDQVRTADGIANQLTKLALGSSQNTSSRAHAIRELFAANGLTAFTQDYEYNINPTLFRSSSSTSNKKTLSGTNTYALFRSPRTDAREAILITASWKSRWNGYEDPDLNNPSHVADNLEATGWAAGRQTDTDGVEGGPGAYERLRLRNRVNVRGIASVIALSEYLSRSLHHSKDIIFLISDGHLDGMQAWASSYFNDEPPSQQATIESLHPSVLGRRIWTSLSLDYPSDSFSHLALLHEGTNGGSPNMDVLNTVVRVAQQLQGTNGVPVILHGVLDGSLDGRSGNAPDDTRTQAELLRSFLPVWLCALLERFVWNGEEGSAALVLAAKALLTQFRLMASGHPSGPHGLLHRYRIDAFTLYAVPARGPYGFLHLGRVVESSLRSFSNLVERLHHSQFFYLLADPGFFIQLPMYIVVPVLLGIAITTFGMRAWRAEGREAQKGRERVAEVVEDWLNQQQREALPSDNVGLNEEDEEDRPRVDDDDIGNDSFVEVEGMLADSTPTSLRKRAARESSTTTSSPPPRRSARIRASMSPEPGGTLPRFEEEGQQDPVLTRESTRKRGTTAEVEVEVEDIPLESPTALQIETHLAQRARAVLSHQSSSGKEGATGKDVDVEELLEMIRAGLEAQDRPVAGALGLMGVAHLGAWGGVLGLVDGLEGCTATGLWACSTYRLLNAFSLAYPLLLILLASLLTHHQNPPPIPTSTPGSRIDSLPPSLLLLPAENQRARLGRLLHAFTLLYLGMLVSVLSVLNFALATSTALLLSLPLCISSVVLSSSSSSTTKSRFPLLLTLGASVFLLVLNPAPALLVFASLGARMGLWEQGAVEAGVESVWVGWKVWGNGTVPFVGGVFQAVVWQAVVGIGLVLLS
ncbi:hypothetical protein A4X06_0g6838 [Tilletia controversa]|uniref:Uncharacterized protein n=1 Tax=Tilletia controversa TaxID=13291 RepID=A0A8X7MNY0_9BASI|nr:hypothetical protein CF335_g5929 [Tilletia laevis]KAE8242597.1 hypothetical protein A4X06_0g6838 [Tilletia controversa]